ncbi:MAG: GYDIA family GHMP kinase [Saprospiraceae bacterium]
MIEKKAALFHAHGKLLLTAEYFVLDGAAALAIPVKFGQSLTVSKNINEPDLHWQSFEDNGSCWFGAVFQKDDFKVIKQNDEAVAKRLQSIFKELKKLNPQLPTANCQLRTDLTFPRNWGLGTSSTLIYLLAKWGGVDPFDLQFKIFGGSGYDIACAGADGPILYELKNGKPAFEKCQFNPVFSDQLFFIFLGKKQNSRTGIKLYAEKNKKIKGDLITEISALTHLFTKENNLNNFEKLIGEHENIISNYIGLEKAKDIYFKDYWGEIKSLGAWGGDFIMATSNRSEKETQAYFNEKGFDVFLPYKDMVL